MRLLATEERETRAGHAGTPMIFTERTIMETHFSAGALSSSSQSLSITKDATDMKERVETDRSRMERLRGLLSDAVDLLDEILGYAPVLPPDTDIIAVDGLSTHTVNILKRSGITTLRMLARKSGTDLLKLKGFGPKALNEVRVVIRDRMK